ncbi:MAG: prepilin-type N-terminal cleavage/methylation domain-containing protein [Candidatus Sumerlaeia bacterium]|nr:prepilin-type N-terminal cleavage/methylation domain-containing protein [Candidatus Sumerlaeia bacterium]
MRARRGFTFTEVLVALLVFLIGIVGVWAVFPAALKSVRESSAKGRAILLAQQKVEEMRRDANLANSLINEISALPAPSTALPMPTDDSLTYSFSGESLQFPVPDASEPASTPGVPRVIVRYAPDFRDTEPVLYELRFLGP